jgi:hypothetical protein
MLLSMEEGTPLYETKRKAEELVQRIRAGESFEELARRHSTHYSADDGGRMLELTDRGISMWVQSRANFRRMLDGLEVGEISDPIVAECYNPDLLRFTATGIIFVRKDGEVPPQKPDFEEVKEMVRWNCIRRDYIEIEAEVKQGIIEASNLQIFEDRLPAL